MVTAVAARLPPVASQRPVTDTTASIYLPISCIAILPAGTAGLRGLMGPGYNRQGTNRWLVVNAEAKSRSSCTFPNFPCAAG